MVWAPSELHSPPIGTKISRWSCLTSRWHRGEYANRQNKVGAADFFATHPFHLRLKDLFGKVYAPSPGGTFRESKWFYEHARGQYHDARGQLTPSALMTFELEFPKKQLITKTDLAEYVTTWDGPPHTVSKGAQKTFADFASAIGTVWKENPDRFNEAYFRDAVSNAIIFKARESLVSAQPWYDGGYRANIVTYAIATLVSDVRTQENGITLDLVWKAQLILPGLSGALVVATAAVRDVIVNPPSWEPTNVTEWAKTADCWRRVADLAIDWPASLKTVLVGSDELRQRASDALREQKVLNGIEAQTSAVTACATVWKQVRNWAIQHKLLSPKELGVLAIAATPDKLPTDRQAIVIMTGLDELRKEGCPIGRR